MLGTTAVQIFNETVSVPWAVMKWTSSTSTSPAASAAVPRGLLWLLQIRSGCAGEGTDRHRHHARCLHNILAPSFCALGDGASARSPVGSSTSGRFLDSLQGPRGAETDQRDDLRGARH